MIVRAQQLLRLPVETETGTRLGRVASFEFEAETQTILRYIVCGGWLFGRREHLIHRNQVIKITSAKMIVEDLRGATALARAERIAKPIAREPAALSRDNTPTQSPPLY